MANIVLNIPKDKFDKVISFLEKYKVKNNNEHILICAKINKATANFFKTGKLVLQGQNKDELEKIKKEITALIFDKENLILGFDETGRSELEGPFVITGVIGNNKDLIELRDSKKTHNIEKAKEKVDKNSLAYVSLVLNPKLIDLLRTKYTLNEIEDKFIQKIHEYFKELNLNFETIVDGSELTSHNKDIKYIKKADDSIAVVASASIISKNIRNLSKNKDKRKSWNVNKS